jgi:hypothetical protein
MQILTTALVDGTALRWLCAARAQNANAFPHPKPSLATLRRFTVTPLRL